MTYAPPFNFNALNHDSIWRPLNAKMTAYEVKTPELKAQLLMDRVVSSLQDAVREAEVFGDPSPSDRALDQARIFIKQVVTLEPELGVTTPTIGIDSKGRIEIGFTSSSDGSNLFAWVDAAGDNLKLVEVQNATSRSAEFPI